MPVLVRYEARAKRTPATLRAVSARVKRHAQRMLAALQLTDSQLSILLCDDATMRVLNREHRGIDKPTDVLAFAMGEGRALVSVAALLGDVVIALPTVARQAREHGVSIERETCLLLAHGILHLLGFDHRTRREERKMTARTHMLMAAALARTSDVEKPRRQPARRRRVTPGQRKDRRE